MKYIYEIFDEFEMAETKQERMKVIQDNLSQTLVDVLKLTYHPDFVWYFDELPENYKIPTDVLPGITFDSLNHQLRRLYLFRKDDGRAANLSDKRRTELLIQMLESLEPREAEVIAGIFRKDQGVLGLDYKFVKEAFPNMLP